MVTQCSRTTEVPRTPTAAMVEWCTLRYRHDSQHATQWRVLVAAVACFDGTSPPQTNNIACHYGESVEIQEWHGRLSSIRGDSTWCTQCNFGSTQKPTSAIGAHAGGKFSALVVDEATTQVTYTVSLTVLEEMSTPRRDPKQCHCRRWILSCFGYNQVDIKHPRTTPVVKRLV